MYDFQKQLSRGVLSKRCSENLQQIYRRTPMSKCDFNKADRSVTFSKVFTKSNTIEITLRHRCSPVNLLHIFRTPFFKNTFGRLLACSFTKSNTSCNFIEIKLRHGCSPMSLLHIFRTLSFQNTSGRLLLDLSVGIRC